MLIAFPDYKRDIWLETDWQRWQPFRLRSFRDSRLVMCIQFICLDKLQIDPLQYQLYVVTLWLCFNCVQSSKECPKKMNASEKLIKSCSKRIDLLHCVTRTDIEIIRTVYAGAEFLHLLGHWLCRVMILFLYTLYADSHWQTSRSNYPFIEQFGTLIPINSFF